MLLTQRFFRVLVLATITVGLYALGRSLGSPWLGLPLALGVVLAMHLVARWRARRRAGFAPAHLERALRPGADRDRAIAELEKVLAGTSLEPGARVKLAVLLSELLQLRGDFAGAARSLDAVADAPTDGGARAGLAYARALLALRAGDAEQARGVLAQIPRATIPGDVALRLELLDAAVELELGDAESALETSNRVRQQAGDDESLSTEARVLRAVALDALGRHDEARDVVRSLGKEAHAAVAAVGLPRARALVESLETPFRGTA